MLAEAVVLDTFAASCLRPTALAAQWAIRLATVSSRLKGPQWVGILGLVVIPG